MSVTLSEAAAKEVQRIMADQKLPAGAVLRVAVVGGGCSGYEYKLGFEEQADGADDVVSESHGIRVAVDKVSARYLSGTQIDFNQDILNRGFVFRNPLAVKTCGCGTSFQV